LARHGEADEKGGSPLRPVGLRRSVFVALSRVLRRQVEACYPDTKIYCWRTAPKVATDDRSHHFFQKRPHVVAALNQMARYAARKRGWCILDMEFMLQVSGRGLSCLLDYKLCYICCWVICYGFDVLFALTYAVFLVLSDSVHL
jgi:hypothetical protein